MQYRARKGNPAYPRLHNGWNIRYGYSTDGYYRKVYILLLHPVDDSCISFQSQYRTQILLGSGVAEGAAAYVVGTGFVVLQYILKGICRAAYNVLRAQNPACVGYGHVFLSKMYAVGMQLLCQFHMVVNDEGGTVLPAKGLHFQSYGFYRFHRGVFHPWSFGG